MGSLRRISTRRLLALCAAAVAVGVGAPALAAAITSGGPVAAPKPLAQALHDALSAPPVEGVTARIKFANRLIDSGLLHGVNPLLTGADGRLWASGGRLRLELQSASGEDSQLVVANGAGFLYDGAGNTVYRFALHRHAGEPPATHADAGRAAREHSSPTVEEISRRLAQASPHLDISPALAGDTAGQASYAVRVAPRRDGGLVGALSAAWDAVHGVPLDLALYAKGVAAPVLELQVTDISFGRVDASAFSVTPPARARIVDVAGPRGAPGSSATLETRGAGPDARGAHGDALRITRRGQGLGTIFIFQRRVRGSGPAPGRSGLDLPTVRIGAVEGHELTTALGTVITFDRGGVSYVVAASQPASVVEDAARGL